MVNKGNHPKWPYFRFVNYYNLPRYMNHVYLAMSNYQRVYISHCLPTMVVLCQGEITLARPWRYVYLALSRETYFSTDRWEWGNHPPKKWFN
jgi:hypothetical protein